MSSVQAEHCALWVSWGLIRHNANCRPDIVPHGYRGLAPFWGSIRHDQTRRPDFAFEIRRNQIESNISAPTEKFGLATACRILLLNPANIFSPILIFAMDMVRRSRPSRPDRAVRSGMIRLGTTFRIQQKCSDWQPHAGFKRRIRPTYYLFLWISGIQTGYPLSTFSPYRTAEPERLGKADSTLIKTCSLPSVGATTTR